MMRRGGWNALRSFRAVALALVAVGACCGLINPLEPAAASNAGFNGEFVFEMDGEIFSQAADGSHLVQVTSDSAVPGGNYGPTWSPDGAQIAYLRIVSIGTGRFRCDVRVMEADGSRIRGSPVLTAIAGRGPSPGRRMGTSWRSLPESSCMW